MSFKSVVKNGLKQIGSGIGTILENSGFMSRSIGMNESYGDLMALVSALGREPISLLGKDYIYIYDHVKRNLMQGTQEVNNLFDGEDYTCYKFTFYGDRPNIWFANPETDIENLRRAWKPSVEFSSTMSVSTEFFYSESNDGYKNNRVISPDTENTNAGIAHGIVQSVSISGIKSCDLIKKTNDNFNAGKYNTLIARFHTNDDFTKRTDDPTQTAINRTYGMSHGRNLTKKTPTTHSGYDNPYCRVWTYHHNYHTMMDAIRPFAGKSGTEVFGYTVDGKGGEASFRNSLAKFGSGDTVVASANDRLLNSGVLDYQNGFVRIAPTAKIVDYFNGTSDGKDGEKYSIKRCMFSIENLAWKNTGGTIDGEFKTYGLSAEQRGPLGGRIMWFPPYDLSISETTSVEWNSNKFIGRGEDVMTYKNTLRTGSLSFSLLIDHPSLINYLSDMYDKGGGVPEGQPSAPVDPSAQSPLAEDDPTELALLRFFAGCDILSVKPQRYPPSRPKPEPKVEEKEPEPTPPPSEEPVVAEPKPMKMFIALYYPNNYSGVADKPEKNPNFAIDYLMTGAGTGKYISNPNEEPVDLPINIESTYYTNSGRKILGYETSENGISIVTDQIKLDATSIKNSIKGVYKHDGHSVTNEAITNADGSEVTISQYGDASVDEDTSYIPAKMVFPLKGDSKENISSRLKEWRYKKWYYRVDDKPPVVSVSTKNPEYTVCETLTKDGSISYVDTISYKLNSTGYKGGMYSGGEDILLNVHKQIKEEGDNPIKWYSFADLYCAANGTCAVSEYSDSANVEEIKKILSQDNGYKINCINFYGNASRQGYTKKNGGNELSPNEKLALNRAETVRFWLINKFNFENILVKVGGINTESSADNVDKGNGNSFVSKAWRSVLIEVDYEQSEINAALDTVKEQVKITPVSVDEVAVLPEVEKIGEKEEAIQRRIDIAYGLQKERIYAEYDEKIKEVESSTEGVYMEQRVKQLIKARDEELKLFRDGIEETIRNADEQREKEEAANTGSTVPRYDNEGEFFQRLSVDAPFLHHKIKEKIKYFDPAFHSISPEGFNSRLTFLQQCTRQGPTIENGAEVGTMAAYNLAFGRPPVCVLRLGDFYYTKIVITNLTINYDTPQWDLNPEGIGVMPMYAKVTINFTFLGGSGIEGPVSRLQNAVSFNYYANTGIYDNRSEVQTYDNNGKTENFIGYVPLNQ